MLLVHEKIHEMCEIQMKWITFVLFRTEKDHYEDTKKRQEDSVPHRREKVNIDNFTDQCWAITDRILRYYWSDVTPLCLAITALIFDNCYNGIIFTSLGFEWFL